MTSQEIRREIKKASSDKTIKADLTKQLATLSKRANQRLRQLKQSGLTTAAQKIADDYLQTKNRKSFSRSKNLSLDDLERELMEVEKFLRYQTSTVRGERQRRQRIIESLKENNIDVSDSDRFFELMESDAFQFFKGFKGQSGGRILEALDLLEQGATISDMEKIYNFYREHENEMDEFEAWDAWTKTDSQNPFNPDEWLENNK